MEPVMKPQPPVKTGVYEIDLQNQLAYQQALEYYNQQVGLSSTATISPIGSLPGGLQGVTPAGMAMPGSEAITAGPGVTTIDTSGLIAKQRISIEQQINDLSNTRISAETELVNLKMKEIAADMQRVQMYKDLLTGVKSTGALPLEDQLQAVYQSRARMGVGGFYGETTNPL
jgi:hypothetical protein